jgi:hypothetical protein
MTFKLKKYQVIKNAISYELANFVYNYFMLKRDAVNFMYKNNIIYDTGIFGTWSDQQVPNTYSHYADFVMETLLMKVLSKMQQETGLELVPTYSYARIYKDGTGSNNVIDEYKNIHKPNAPKGTKVLLDVGDMLVYSGCELEHWREPLEGDNCAQVFLHYNHLNGKFAKSNIFDRRPMLGVPSYVK